MNSDLNLRRGISSLRLADIAMAVYVFAAIVLEDGSTPAKIARVILVAAAILETSVKPLTGNLVTLWQVCFVAFAASSIIWAYSPDYAVSMAVTLTINGICIVALVYLTIDDPTRIRLFLICMMIAPTLLMLRIAVQSDRGLWAFLDSREAGTTNANIVGMAGAFGFGIAYLGISKKILVGQWISRLFLFTNLFVVAFSASRKAVAMVALIILLFSLLHKQSRGIPRVVKVALAISLAFVGYWLIMNFGPLYELVGHRMETMFNAVRGSGQVDASTATRLSLIEKGILWFQEAPWVGHGGDNFRALMASYYPHESALYAHNNFVEILVDFGVVGFVLFYWMYIAIIAKGMVRRSNHNAVQSMVLTLMITLLLMEYGAIDYYSRIFMAFVGVAWVVLCTDALEVENRDQTRDVMDNSVGAAG